MHKPSLIESATLDANILKHLINQVLFATNSNAVKSQMVLSNNDHSANSNHTIEKCKSNNDAQINNKENGNPIRLEHAVEKMQNRNNTIVCIAT